MPLNATYTKINFSGNKEQIQKNMEYKVMTLYFHGILGGNVTFIIEEIQILAINQLKNVNLAFAIEM